VDEKETTGVGTPFAMVNILIMDICVLCSEEKKINPLISKQLFSTALKEQGYNYGICSPADLQILQPESHGSQLSGA
jgi:hypothetical protein